MAIPHPVSRIETRNLAVSRSVVIGGGARLERAMEVFNVTNRRNDLTRNGNFGAGTYPTSPVSTFNQITAVADPRAVQFARVKF